MVLHARALDSFLIHHTNHSTNITTQDCEYLRRLMALFQEREQQADVEGCRLLARLFKNIGAYKHTLVAAC